MWTPVAIGDGAEGIGVMAGHKMYLIHLSEIDDGDHNVRTYFNADVPSGLTELHGELWDSRTICRDFNIVIKMFREFFSTGNVSRNNLV